MERSNALLPVYQLTVQSNSFGIIILMSWAAQHSKKWQKRLNAEKTRSKNSCLRMLSWPESGSASKKPSRNLANTDSTKANAESAPMTPWAFSKRFSAIQMGTTVFLTPTVRVVSTDGPSNV